MKKIFKNLSILIVASLIFTSCEDESDNTNASLINYSPATVTLSSTSNTVFDQSAIDPDDESTYIITITATLPSAQPIDAVIDLVKSGGNANAKSFKAGTIKIPAGATTASANVEVLKNGEIEGMQTLEISGKSRANFIVSPFTFSATITDYVNDVLEFSTNWSGEYSYDAGSAQVTLDFCEMDIDVLLYTATGAYVQALGATGACTETGSMSGLPDGDYFLVLNVYENPHSVFGATETVPVTISYSQEHFKSDKFVSTSLNLSSADGANALTAVATITKSGYNYTVTPL